MYLFDGSYTERDKIASYMKHAIVAMFYENISIKDNKAFVDRFCSLFMYSLNHYMRYRCTSILYNSNLYRLKMY